MEIPTALFVIAKASPQNSSLSCCPPCLAHLLHGLSIASTVGKRREPHAGTCPIYDAPYLPIRARGDSALRRTCASGGGATQSAGLLVDHDQPLPAYCRVFLRYGPRYCASPVADSPHLHGGSDAAHRAETTAGAGYARGVCRALSAG